MGAQRLSRRFRQPPATVERHQSQPEFPRRPGAIVPITARFGVPSMPPRISSIASHPITRRRLRCVPISKLHYCNSVEGSPTLSRLLLPPIAQGHLVKQRFGQLRLPHRLPVRRQPQQVARGDRRQGLSVILEDVPSRCRRSATVARGRAPGTPFESRRYTANLPASVLLFRKQ